MCPGSVLTSLMQVVVFKNVRFCYGGKRAHGVYNSFLKYSVAKNPLILPVRWNIYYNWIPSFGNKTVGGKKERH